jgi:hypothetical protein
MDTTKIRPMLFALEDESRLSKWEMGFVESLSEQFEDKGRLSQKQYDKLEELYRRYN